MRMGIGALTEAIKTINKLNPSESDQGPAHPLPVDCLPFQSCSSAHHILRPRNHVADRGEIANAGGELFETTEPHTILDDMFLVSDPLLTARKPHSRAAESIFHHNHTHTQSSQGGRLLICSLKDKGLVVITGCSPVGLKVVSSHAINLVCGPDAGNDTQTRVHALVGGFHMDEAEENELKAAARDLEKISPDFILGGNCTGLRLQLEIEESLPGRQGYERLNPPLQSSSVLTSHHALVVSKTAAMDSPTDVSTIICPLGIQRSMRGLILKLFLANFVCLCFYFHCYHQREGRYLTLDAIVFFIAPLNTVLRYSAALLSIAGYACYGIVSSFRVQDGPMQREATIITTRRALSLFLGQRKSPDYDRYTSFLDGVSPKSERIAGKIGPVIPALGFIVQCCGAIYLYNRRRQWNGAAMIDEQIFQLAYGGLALGILSAGYTLRLPFFKNAIPDSRDSYIEHIIHALRDQSDDTEFLRNEPALIRRSVYLLKSLAFAFLVQLLILRNPVFVDKFHELISPIWWLWVLILGFLSAVSILSAPPLPRGLPTEDKALRNAVLFCSFFIYLALGLMLTAGMVGALVWHLSFYIRLGLQVAGLRNEPLDEPCPLLRADSQAEYIWWLG
ncbi:hypothetical protein BJY04DRAFT_213622 [Aspergillus karnatakaensis]|uniref:uncharacterized protein n=1 Tax=Aspergillus karnatakaensis TaxID=1810916 RepID=UPI003CCE0554